MNPLTCGHGVIRQIDRSVQSLRRQAPGARMIGEFVVRQAVAEVRRRVGSPTPPKQPSA